LSNFRIVEPNSCSKPPATREYPTHYEKPVIVLIISFKSLSNIMRKNLRNLFNLWNLEKSSRRSTWKKISGRSR